MRLLKRVLVGSIVALLAVVVAVALSIPVDRLLNRGEVAALTNITIPTDTGEVRAYLPPAEMEEALPAIIMIHEFWGLRPSIIGKAEALAEEGYVVVAPDTFRGHTTNWLPTAIWQTLRTPQERVDADLDAVFAWLRTQPSVAPSRIMVMGFCYGGRAALHYSLHNNELAATGVFYGTPLTDAERLAALPGPLLGIFGAEDRSIPAEDVRAFEQALAAANVPHEVILYPEVGHAFVSDTAEIRAGGAAGDAWQAFLTFAATTLKDTP